jgi:hypothetical protein
LIPRLPYALAALSVCLPASPFPSSVSRYTGKWELVRQESDNIDKAVESTIASMSFIARPIARMKLKRRNVAFPHFTIEQSSGGVRVRHEQGLDVLYPEAGVAVKTRAPDGTGVVARLDADTDLLLSYDAGEGRREDRYALRGDGSTLTLSVRLTSSKLPKPLSYRLVYRRSR